MAFKNLINLQLFFSLVVVFGTASCAHLVQQKRGSAEQNTAINSSDSVDPYSDSVSTEEADGSVLPGLGTFEENNDERKAKFAVWIDSQGVDAFAALGFLQAMDKNGLQPAKVMGSGLGCWIALSWAYAGNPNRAEWQAFKWNDWRVLRGTLLNRLTRSSQSEFEDNVRKLMPLKSWDELSLPADCPVVSGETPFEMLSARDLTPETAFWISMQLKSFGVDDSRLVSGGFRSGFYGGAPEPAELLRFSRDLKSTQDERFVGWLVLSTRDFFRQERSGALSSSQLLSGRDVNWPVELMSPEDDGAYVKVLKLSLLGGTKQSNAMSARPENRRRYLVLGRKMMERVLQEEKLQNFLE